MKKVSVHFFYADSRMPISYTQGSNKYYLHYDQVGSLKAVTDNNHNIIKEIAYDSFGNILSDSDPNIKVPFAFAGGLYDEDTRLLRFGYRDYDSYTGKWTAKDPIDFDGDGFNLYGYVLNDPVNFVDSQGLATQSCYRPLKVFPFAVIGNDTDKSNNTIIGHEHIFFDNGTDIGYSGDGIYSGEDKKKYSQCENIDANKKEVMTTINKLKNNFKSDDYHLLPRIFNGNNCQDFVQQIKNNLGK